MLAALSLLQRLRKRAHSVISQTGSKLLFKAAPFKWSPSWSEPIDVADRQHTRIISGREVKDSRSFFGL